jgi:hypothetical protein
VSGAQDPWGPSPRLAGDPPAAADLTGCPAPDCALPASISSRYALESTGGPVEHVHLQCPGGHWFRMPTALLPSAA